MTTSWDPNRYLNFGDERTRPVGDLLAAVTATDPSVIVDLGCGPGNSTAIAAQRWPGAHIRGIDSSPDMIEKAREAVPDLEFAVQGIAEWASTEDQVDVVMSNAALQWLPNHRELLAEIVRNVAEGGWLAFQVPGNYRSPSHTVPDELAAHEPYRPYLQGLSRSHAFDAESYLRDLRDLGCRVNAWETTYLHQLRGEDAVFDWISGTSLRPTMDALSSELRESFAEELKARLREAYPLEDGLVILPFRRVFVVAQKN